MIGFGNTEITKAYLGGIEISKMYLGDELVFGGEPIPVPYDAKIEYIEKQDGANSLIDLGTRADAVFEITAQATVTKSTSMTLLNRHSASTGGAWFGVPSNGRWGFGTGSGAYSNVFALNKTDITVDFTVNPIVGTIGGNTFSRTKGGSNRSWHLFGAYNNNYPFIGRLYALKAYIGGELTFDLIPCRVGNVGYFYDKVSKKLFGNINSDDFILGNDIT